jgi:hypothetical protein
MTSKCPSSETAFFKLSFNLLTRTIHDYLKKTLKLLLPFLLMIKNPSYVDNDVAGVEDLLVSSPDDFGVAEPGQARQDGAGQRLVAVKGPIVSSNLDHFQKRISKHKKRCETS